MYMYVQVYKLNSSNVDVLPYQLRRIPACGASYVMCPSFVLSVINKQCDCALA